MIRGSVGFVSRRVVTVPGAPTIDDLSIVNDTEVLISFTQPTNDGGSAIIEYVPYVSPSPPGNYSYSTTGTNQIRVIASFAYNITYTFTLKAKNVAGESTPSNSFSAQVNTGKMSGGTFEYKIGSYTYHVFINNGTLVADKQVSNIEIFMIGAGGGATGNNSTEVVGGGGGGGQARIFSNNPFGTIPVGGTISVAVGAGGAGSAAAAASSGNLTTVTYSPSGTLTSYGGGGGGYTSAGRGGGSAGGGGGSASYAEAWLKGTGTQSGGDGTRVLNLVAASGGGGGISTAGTNGIASSQIAGNGGSGSTTYSSWDSIGFLNSGYSGGGAGALLNASGLSSGTATNGGGSAANGGNGASFTGGGAGAGLLNTNGGSGIVIVRYLT